MFQMKDLQMLTEYHHYIFTSFVSHIIFLIFFVHFNWGGGMATIVETEKNNEASDTAIKQPMKTVEEV